MLMDYFAPSKSPHFFQAAAAGESQDFIRRKHLIAQKAVEIDDQGGFGEIEMCATQNEIKIQTFNQKRRERRWIYVDAEGPRRGFWRTG